MVAPLSPWPRLRESWWVLALVGLAIVVFPISLLVEVRCGFVRCHGAWWARAFALDALGGLPRLYTTGLFVGVAVLAWLAARRTEGRVRTWWTAVAAIGALLAVAKLVSAHSSAKEASALATLLVGLAGTVLALSWLAVFGRRWGVAAVRSVVLAMALYAVAALGLELASSLLVAVQDRVGLLSHVATTFVEELGEAMAALLLLVTVRWQLPARQDALETARSSG